MLFDWKNRFVSSANILYDNFDDEFGMSFITKGIVRGQVLNYMVHHIIHKASARSLHEYHFGKVIVKKIVKEGLLQVIYKRGIEVKR
jgi:hypothetical protein